MIVVVIFWLRGERGEGETARYDIGIVKLPTEDGAEVLYRAYQPVRELEIPFPPEMIDSLSKGEGAEEITLEATREGVLLRADAPFDLAGIIVSRDAPVPEKAAPVAQFGKDALVLNMTAFTPVRVEGQRVSPASDEKPFSWVSEAKPAEVGEVDLFLDPGLPAQVSEALRTGLLRLPDYYAEAFGHGLEARSQLMVLYEQGFAGQLKVEGDTVRGQSLIKFTGEGFGKDSPEARTLVYQTLAHETGHLYQLEDTRSAEAPDWLHEGAAEALADEALFMTGLWKAEDYLKALTEAKQDCADELKNGPLNRAAREERHRAGYVCGQTILVAVTAQNKGANVKAMWQAFLAYAREAEAGFTVEAFLGFAESWSQSEAFVRSLKSFLESDYSYADREATVEQMFQGTL